MMTVPDSQPSYLQNLQALTVNSRPTRFAFFSYLYFFNLLKLVILRIKQDISDFFSAKSVKVNIVYNVYTNVFALNLLAVY